MTGTTHSLGGGDLAIAQVFQQGNCTAAASASGSGAAAITASGPVTQASTNAQANGSQGQARAAVDAETAGAQVTGDSPTVVAREAPRGGDPMLDLTVPLLSGGGGSLAAGMLLLVRALSRFKAGGG